jgi:hypothetical protein
VEESRIPGDETRIPTPLAASDLAVLLGERLASDGSAGVIQAAVALAQLGYAACSGSGASLSPFPVSQVPLPPAPAGDDPQAWELYAEMCAEAILSGRDYSNPNLGPQLLSAAIRPKERRVLPYLLRPLGPTRNADGQTVIARHSVAEGRTPAELIASVNGARQSLARIAFEGEEILQEKPPADGAITVIARARRAKYPGIVFARAAASREVDPLTDEETRVLVGV